MTATITAQVLVSLLPLLIGIFVGAWIQHRAGRGQSPLPSLPLRDGQKTKVEQGEQDRVMPRLNQRV